ncbi:HD domain-containing protein [Agitococcus lubricus]|uniref:HD domain-containing protein n=1 Tax=Agitococcus lubricus TaxID=1077255 RepID=A0A2T5J198_9GAMM|nr:HD domain-containing protein [Agitococcus lubricus]PTQ90162.1 HD domain-containing protein [Agitococcus lubricus]
MSLELLTYHFLLDDLLNRWQPTLGKEYVAYKNHCYRVLNFYRALVGDNTEAIDKAAIAVAFHDLGIWTDQSLDYLAPSARLARHYLHEAQKSAWESDVLAMITLHHKIWPYSHNPLVDAFRKADWLDVSLGQLPMGLSKSFIRRVKQTWPNAGFHVFLAKQSVRHTLRHPFKPLPMFRW